MLQLLGWQHFYNPAGYTISTVLPANSTIETWHALGCLASLTNLTLTGSLPDLPNDWAVNGSFPALLLLNLSWAQLAGTLPELWSQSEAWPQLVNLDLSNTSVGGSLPVSWGQPGAFRKLSYLGLAHTEITGLSVLDA